MLRRTAKCLSFLFSIGTLACTSILIAGCMGEEPDALEAVDKDIVDDEDSIGTAEQKLVSSGSFYYTASNTLNATQNVALQQVELAVGETLRFATCGIIPGSSFTGDTYLRLANSAQSIVAFNDDACVGMGSMIVHKAWTSGTYTIRAGCFGSGSCAGTVAWTVEAASSSSCPSGYSGDGITCTDINECSMYNGGCNLNATCTNTPGSSTCACKSGYAGDGITCADINECLTNNGGCGANATCTNTPGSRTCACSSGYTGNGFTCGDVNECLTNNGGCSLIATCTNTPGSRTCACKSGFSGDGITCTDINECLTNNGGCSANATCTNTPGSRKCNCKWGFGGDGITCTPL